MLLYLLRSTKFLICCEENLISISHVESFKILEIRLWSFFKDYSSLNLFQHYPPFASSFFTLLLTLLLLLLFILAAIIIVANVLQLPKLLYPNLNYSSNPCFQPYSEFVL